MLSNWPSSVVGISILRREWAVSGQICSHTRWHIHMYTDKRQHIILALFLWEGAVSPDDPRWPEGDELNLQSHCRTETDKKIRLVHESEEKNKKNNQLVNLFKLTGLQFFVIGLLKGNSANFKHVESAPYEDYYSASKDSYIMYFRGSRVWKKNPYNPMLYWLRIILTWVWDQYVLQV